MATVDDQILAIGKNISNNIDALHHDRAVLSQNLLSQLRNLVEAVAVRLHLGKGVEFHYSATGPAIDWIGSEGKQISYLHRFHRWLQESVSHYTFDGDDSERLMLKYYEFLLRTRNLLRDQCGIDIMCNLEKFPVDLDPSLREYHSRIAERIHAGRTISYEQAPGNRYYIRKVRPFFTDSAVFYEVTFSNATDRTGKYDRSIAFTDIDMTDHYAANLVLSTDSIDVLGVRMPITIIRGWEISIRPCEFNNFARIFDRAINVSSGDIEYRELMRFLTDTSGSLLDLMDMATARYEHIRRAVTGQVRKPAIFPVLDAARRIIRAKRAGHNILRYLMLTMDNRRIKDQFRPGECGPLSDLRLAYGCIPFDSMPFCSSPLRHNPRIVDLLESLDVAGREHELLARRVKNNVELHGTIYTPVSELEDLGSVDDLIVRYNSNLYYKHAGRKLVRDKNYVFMQEYEDDVVSIIEELQGYATSGVDGYGEAVECWLDTTRVEIDDGTKRAVLRSLFTRSRVAIIYGAAGTGKSTMVNYIADYFGNGQRLFLAQTNPAVDNLRRRVSAPGGHFRTISSHIRRRDLHPDYDVLVVDECSTVSNSDMLEVLQSTSFKTLVLVGDVYQIESIQFGNWFSVIRSFIPKESVFQLTSTYRTKKQSLLDFWSRVRHLKEGVEELIAQNGYSGVLDESLFRPQQGDEIVLCLNYDGLYGINNINRFLQSGNPRKSVVWGAATYKVGDPVLFNENDRFRPLIFNNLKGRIVDVIDHFDHVQFDIRLGRSVTAADVGEFADLRYVGDSTVSFDVYRGNADADDERVDTAVPFQVAYAVSIHKAQGLEYDSVKVVITDANEERISHSVFYTAITRTREHLRIFWTPETQRTVLSRLAHTDNPRNIALLKKRRGVAPI